MAQKASEKCRPAFCCFRLAKSALLRGCHNFRGVLSLHFTIIALKLKSHDRNSDKPMKIDYLDGERLRQAVIAGARRVILMQENLNRMNVFPVPDNDTGTNMALTMQSIAEGAIGCRDRTVSGMSQCLADAALMGARGNSGAILAQFFQGFCERFQGKKIATLAHFGEAVAQARNSSYEALTEPKEGTILTVIHDWAERINKQCHKSQDFLELFKAGLQEAQRSLKDTPKKLKLLAKAGVVDAGAQGFVHMLEGIHHFMQTGEIDSAVGIGGASRTARAKVDEDGGDIAFQFCTECLIEGEKIDRTALRQQLKAHGNSLIVAGSARKIRVHIHTNEPEVVFDLARTFGSVSKQKYDDMRKQHAEAYHPDEHKTTIAIVTDSSCDLTPEFVIRHNIQTVPVQVIFGSETYVDKITITPNEFYRMLRETRDFPTTSQPTPGEFKATYEELWGHYEHAISIHLSGKLSGTLQAAKMAARSCGDEHRVTVIDGCNLSIALGLLVAEAAHAVEAGCSVEEVVERVERAKKNVRFFICFDTVTYLIRGGRLSKSKGWTARLLHLKPVLTISPEGTLASVAKTVGSKAALRKVLSCVLKTARGKRNLKFAVGHTGVPEKADWLESQLRQHFDSPAIMKVDVSPALGVHVGPGAAGVAFLGE